MRGLMIIAVVAMLYGPGYALGASLQEAVMGLKEPLTARVDRGIVHEVDLARRTCMIGGYIYEMGPPGSPAKVTMLNSRAGAFELLQPGMKVEVTYGDLGTTRLIAALTQLPSSADVEH